MVKLELNGIWELRDAAGALLCPVTVPGSVISGLYAAESLRIRMTEKMSMRFGNFLAGVSVRAQL